MFNRIGVLFLLFACCVSCQKKEIPPEKNLHLNFQEGDLPSFHPHDLATHLSGLSLAKILYEPLTRINTSGEVELAGAKHIHICPNHLTYTFILRDNCWSDGSVVTAYNYESAWKQLLSPQTQNPQAELFYCLKNGREAHQGRVSLDAIGVRALDASILIVDLAYPFPHFLELISQAIACPKTEMPAFNGPFAVSEWDEGTLLHLKPNPYYWDKSHVHLPGIDISFIEDHATVLYLYQQGKLDWIDPLTKNEKLQGYIIDSTGAIDFSHTRKQ